MLVNLSRRGECYRCRNIVQIGEEGTIHYTRGWGVCGGVCVCVSQSIFGGFWKVSGAFPATHIL